MLGRANMRLHCPQRALPNLVTRSCGLSAPGMPHELHRQCQATLGRLVAARRPAAARRAALAQHPLLQLIRVALLCSIKLKRVIQGVIVRRDSQPARKMHHYSTLLAQAALWTNTPIIAPRMQTRLVIHRGSCPCGHCTPSETGRSTAHHIAAVCVQVWAPSAVKATGAVCAAQTLLLAASPDRPAPQRMADFLLLSPFRLVISAKQGLTTTS